MEHIDYDKLLSEFHEEAYEITLYNKQLGVSASVPVFPSNTLKQVIEGYHDLIGIPSSQLSTYLKVLDTQIKISFSNTMLEMMGTIPKDLSAFDGVFDIDTPLKKQNFEAQTAQEFNAKQEALFKLRQTKEAQILNQVQTAAKAVMVTQKLDAVLSDQVVFVGGIDITDLVIKKLKGN